MTLCTAGSFKTLGESFGIARGMSRSCKICGLLHRNAGVSPISDLIFLSAPFFKSKAATSKYPFLHAQCKAVLEKEILIMLLF